MPLQTEFRSILEKKKEIMVLILKLLSSGNRELANQVLSMRLSDIKLREQVREQILLEKL